MEEKLQQLLNDPESMAQVFSMAQSFTQPSESSPLIDEGMMMGLLQVLQQMQQTDSRQDALVRALKPYLAPERREKLDRAAQLAKIWKIAGVALRKSD